MTLTFSEMQDEVLSHGFSQEAYRARIKMWLSEGLRRIAREVELPQTETPVTISLEAGTASYLLGEKLARVEGIFGTSSEGNPYPIRSVDPADVDLSTPATASYPSYYALEGDQIVFYPTPSRASDVTVRLRTIPSDLVDDDDQSSLPDDYANLAITWALQRAYAAEQDPEMATYWRNWFDRDLMELRTADQYRDETARRQVQGMVRGVTGPRFLRP